jgi:hypothetical protein
MEASALPDQSDHSGCWEGLSADDLVERADDAIVVDLGGHPEV